MGAVRKETPRPEKPAEEPAIEISAERETVRRRALEVPPEQAEIPAEREPFFEPAEYDGEDLGIQLHENPRNGGFFLSLADRSDQAAQRAGVEVRHQVAGQLDRFIGSGRVARERPVARLSENEVVRPRANFVAEALRVSLQEGGRLVEAEEEAQKIFERDYAAKLSSVAGVVYEQPVDPAIYYGIALDSRQQELPNVAWEERTTGEIMADTINNYVLEKKEAGTPIDELPFSSVGPIRARLKPEGQKFFDEVLNRFSELRISRPLEDLSGEPEFQALSELIEAKGPELLGRAGQLQLERALRAMSQGSDRETGREQAVDAFLLQVEVTKPLREATRQYRELLDRAAGVADRDAFAAELAALPADQRYRTLNPDVRLFLVEQLKKTYREKFGRLDEGLREKIDRLREPELGDEVAAVDEAFERARLAADRKTGKLSAKAAKRLQRELPELSPEARVALFDRLQRNGFLEPGSEAAGALLNEERLGLATSGDVYAYSISENGTDIQDVSERLTAQGEQIELDVGLEGKPKTETIRRLDLAVRPGSLLVVSDKPIERSLLIDVYSPGMTLRELRQTLEQEGTRPVIIKAR